MTSYCSEKVYKKGFEAFDLLFEIPAMGEIKKIHKKLKKLIIFNLFCDKIQFMNKKIRKIHFFELSLPGEIHD